MHNVLELSGKHWPGERCYLLEADYFGPNAHIVDQVLFDYQTIHRISSEA
jgi:hypothetical protein